MNKLLLSIAAIVLLGLAAGAMADNKGPCPGGFWPDGKGCCPEIIYGRAYYRDYNNKCYPKEINHKVFYADGNGCYPDEHGQYPPAGKDCSDCDKCEPRCIKPDDDCHEESTTKKYETTSKYYPESTTKKYETTTEYCPEETTTKKHETSSRKHHRSTTKKHETTTEYCPEETTTRKQETTTKKHETTTEYCPEETTTQKHETEPRGPCPGGKWPDGCDCCPRKIDYSFFYRDGRGCYPIKTEKGVLYADGNGCYPDNKGNYLKAGEHCPKDRQCCEECDRCN